MTREDYIRVAIRVLGIYLLVMAVITAPTLVWSGYATWASRHVPLAEGAGMRWDALLQRNNSMVFIGAGARFLAFFLTGLYLVRNGRFVFRLVNRQDPLSSEIREAGEGSHAQPHRAADAADHDDGRGE